MTEFETIIGLETHIQLNTNAKIFCSCKADSWYDPPNTNICPVCTGLPGVLPVLNQAVAEKGALLAFAMHSEILPVSYFDRKNYFYPDLPKGYQISQYDMSLAKGGFLDVPLSGGAMRHVRIHKLHLEEDAGKTKNEVGRRLIDFNRCGVPLVEMVTEPDLRSSDEAMQYLIRLRQLIRWLGISEGNMERGHLRCDANVSIRPIGADYLNPKTEIKNVNSLVAVKDAIETEVERQIREVQAGNQIKSWSLNWDSDAQVLRKMRSKETEADYRYFREPDLLPLQMNQERQNAILSRLPELPLERRARFIAQYGLPEYDADILTSERGFSDYFETALHSYGGDPKRVSNWIINDVMRMLNEKGGIEKVVELRLTPLYLVEIIKLVDSKMINTSTGKELLEKVEATGKSPETIVKEDNLAKVTDTDFIRSACEEIIAKSPKEVENYKKGKTTLIGWFVGQVMQKTRGKADPQSVREKLESLLSS
ncbi:MAG: Asp-tRNA(Asn)/Glu-tRNA(Gln) amidotransferase subunit GatB [Chloroflexota bacterium]